MSNVYAVVANGQVVNVIIADAPRDANDIDVTHATTPPGPGWSWDGNVFAPPLIAAGSSVPTTGSVWIK